MKKRVLITGAGGFLGGYLLKTKPDQYEVFATVYNHPAMLNADRCVSLDLMDTYAIQRVLNNIRPELIIHTAAISSEAACRAEPPRAYKVNVASVDEIGRWAEQNGSKMLFTSTDLVFNGKKAPYLETDRLGTLMEYGCLKAQAELCASNYKDSLVVRLPLLYGIGYGRRKGSLWDFISKCRSGVVSNLFVDEFRSPLYVRDAAQFIWKLLGMNISGTFHLGGVERVSRSELARKFCQAFRLDENLVCEIKRGDVRMDYRPEDTSLNSEKAIRIGFKPMDIDEALCEIQREWKSIL